MVPAGAGGQHRVMDQTSETPQPPPPSYAAPPPSGSDTFERISRRLRSLRRSRSTRVFAGVCGGVARSLGLDPVFVRVLVAVLALFGGAGVVLYLVGWLLLPEDDGRRSVVERAARPSEPGARRPIGLAVLLVVVGLISISFVFDQWVGAVLLALVVFGLLVWVDRRGERVQPVGYAGSEPAPMTTPMAMSTTTSDAGAPPSAPAWTQPVGPPPGPPPAPRPRSVLFALTASCVLIALGALGAADASGASVRAGTYPALALAVVGVGLLAGAWFGRSRGLIVIGLVLAVVTAGAVGADRIGNFGGDAVDLTLRPTTVAELPASAEYAVGSATFDLTGVDFSNADASMAVSIGAGEIIVIVPPDVDVTVNASMGVGEVLLFSDSSGGPGVDRTVTDLGGDGTGGGSLDLTLDAGVGNLEVRRG